MLKNEKLFFALLETFELLKSKEAERTEMEAIECVTLVRILDALGYGREDVDWGIGTTEPIKSTLSQLTLEKKKSVIFLINKSLKESHL